MEGFVVKRVNDEFLGSTYVLEDLDPSRFLTFPDDVAKQEEFLKKDIIPVLIGEPSECIRFAETFDDSWIGNRIVGPSFVISNDLSMVFRPRIKTFAKCGRFYYGLRSFADCYSKLFFGSVNQGFSSEIRRFLAEYASEVDLISQRFASDPEFHLVPAEHILRNGFMDKMMHLYEIAREIHMETAARYSKFRHPESTGITTDPNFDAFLESVNEDIRKNGSVDVTSDMHKFEICKGGLSLRIVQERLVKYRGELAIVKFLQDVFEAMSKKYVRLLNTWLFYGRIDDPFDEFFIRKSPILDDQLILKLSTLWYDQYLIKSDGLVEQFEGKDIQKAILETGRLLNVYRQGSALIDSESLDVIDEMDLETSPLRITSLYASDLLLKVGKLSDRANNFVLLLMFKGYNLREHIHNLHRAFLMDDASQFNDFLVKSYHDLRKRTLSLRVPLYFRQFKLNFLGELKFSSSSFYQDALSVVNIHSVNPSSERDMTMDDGVSKFVMRATQRDKDEEHSSVLDSYVASRLDMDVQLPFPINLFISFYCIAQYSILFKVQTCIKFVAHQLSETWRKLKRVRRPGIRKWHILTFRVRRFVDELQNHINHSVIAPNLEKLSEKLNEFQRHVDDTDPREVEKEEFQQAPTVMSKSKSLFDEKLLSFKRAAPPGSRGSATKEKYDVSTLMFAITTYLSSMLSGLLLMNLDLLQSLHQALSYLAHCSEVVNKLMERENSAEILFGLEEDFHYVLDELVANMDGKDSEVLAVLSERLKLLRR